jgi:type IV secretory pathway VirB6-like protein
MMFDALSYRSWLKTLVAYISSPCLVNTSCILSKSRIEYLLSHA